MPAFPFYAYVHENGDVICKSAFVCETGITPDEYFDSPFVIEWWKVNNKEDWDKVQDFADQYRKDKQEGNPNPGILKFSDLLKGDTDE